MVENNERLKNSEQLLEDLYLNLRQKLLKWAHITSQTPQARMGYVGQHLTSIVSLSIDFNLSMQSPKII